MKTNLNIKSIAEFTLLCLFENGVSVCPLKLQKNYMIFKHGIWFISTKNYYLTKDRMRAYNAL